MRFRALLSGLALACACTAPSMADLQDVTYSVQPGQGAVWLSFDDQPSAVSAQVTENGLVLTVLGIEARSRTIAPVSNALVSSVQVAPQGDAGVRIMLTGQQVWSGAQAGLFPGGVWVRFGLDGSPVETSAMVSQASPDMPAVRRTAPGGDFAPAQVAHHADPEPQPDAVGVDHMATDSGAPASASAHAGPDDHASADDHAPAPAAPSADTAPARQAASSGSGQPTHQGPPPAACAAQAAAVDESPWDDERLFAHAACLTQEDDLGRAAAIYEQMLAFEPENFRALIALAELRVEQGEESAARALYNQAASHAISDAEAARARARLRDLREH